MKIALFRYHTGGGYDVVHSEETSKYTNAVRTSEWVEVEFPKRDAAEIAAAEKVAADARRQKLLEEIAKLDKMARSELAELGV